MGAARGEGPRPCCTEEEEEEERPHITGGVRRRRLLLLFSRCVRARRWRLLLLFSAAGSVSPAVRDALRMGAALLGVKRRITSVNYTRTNNQRGGLKPNLRRTTS